MPTTRSKKPRVLIADDQADVLHSLRLLLKTEGYEITTADTPARVLECARRLDLDVILMDMNYARDTTSGREGLDLLTQLLALDGSLRVVVMTAWGTIDLAVEAMRRGARDFIQKPWENERLLTVLEESDRAPAGVASGTAAGGGEPGPPFPATRSPDHSVPGHASGPGFDRLGWDPQTLTS